MKHIKLFESFSINEGVRDENLKHLEGLKKRILEACPTAKIETFDSGNIGMSIVIDSRKWFVFDQPGVVGLDDQNQPHIDLTQSGKTLLTFGPDYHSKSYGDVSMDPKIREEAYNKILDYFKKLA